MAYLISDNNFANDTRGIRDTRLYFLSHSVDNYAAELEIVGATLDWARGASDVYNAAQVKRSVEVGEAAAAFQIADRAIDSLKARYQTLKDLLKRRFAGDEDALRIYGIVGATPVKRQKLIDQAEELIEGNERLRADGDVRALPESMESAFGSLVEDAKEKYYQAGLQRREAREAVAELNELFETDTAKLRALYRWVLTFWDARDPRVGDLGFARARRRGGGPTPPAPKNLRFDSGVGRFDWDAVEKATSYQLVYRSAGGGDWAIAYSGDETSAAFDPGSGAWDFKVRARNANGYGEFSEEIRIEL